MIAHSFERVSESEALEVASEVFGIDARDAQRMDSERDDTFRLSAASGDEFVLKIAHPDDDAAYVDLQSKALAHAAAAAPLLPLQREVGSPTRVRGRFARMLSWLPGEPLTEHRPSGGELELLGRALGSLSHALGDFAHPAARRPFVWDLAQAGELRALLAEFPSAAAERALDAFDARVAPHLGALPWQVIHNDFNPGNVLVEPGAEPFVTGVVDFGDTVHSVRVADLAVALSYLQYPGGHDEAELARFVAGFEQVVPLEPLERELLPTLVATRFAQRILVNQLLGRGAPGARRDLSAAIAGSTAAIGTLLGEG